MPPTTTLGTALTQLKKEIKEPSNPPACRYRIPFRRNSAGVSHPDTQRQGETSRHASHASLGQFQGTLAGRYLLLFPLHARLHVVFPLSNFRNDARFFAHPLEPSDRRFKGLSISNRNADHPNTSTCKCCQSRNTVLKSVLLEIRPGEAADFHGRPYRAHRVSRNIGTPRRRRTFKVAR